MKTRFFTFGQLHVHSVNGRTWDKDVIVKITTSDPRQTMIDTFGRKWAMEYEEHPDPQHELFKETRTLL